MARILVPEFPCPKAGYVQFSRCGTCGGVIRPALSEALRECAQAHSEITGGTAVIFGFSPRMLSISVRGFLSAAAAQPGGQTLAGLKPKERTVFMSDWNPALYLRFKKERTQPAEDLAARLELTPAKALDVGCGPGNSTQVVANRFPGAKVLGVDFSSNMVGAAQRAHPELEFLQCDVSTQLDTLPHDFDLVFSNACIQWVPEHPRLLPGLLSLLNPGGVLAVQVPMNFQEPIHQIIARTVEREEWRERIPYHRSFYTLKPPICTGCLLTSPSWSGTAPRACGPIWTRRWTRSPGRDSVRRSSGR